MSLQNFHIHIGMSPPKSHDRVEWCVEKTVEVGIHEISFIQTQFSERKMIKFNRSLKRAVSSMKQSLKASLPVINEIVPMDKFLMECDETNKFIGYLNGKKNKSN